MLYWQMFSRLVNERKKEGLSTGDVKPFRHSDYLSSTTNTLGCETVRSDRLTVWGWWAVFIADRYCQSWHASRVKWVMSCCSPLVSDLYGWCPICATHPRPLKSDGKTDRPQTHRACDVLRCNRTFRPYVYTVKSREAGIRVLDPWVVIWLRM